MPPERGCSTTFWVADEDGGFAVFADELGGPALGVVGWHAATRATPAVSPSKPSARRRLIRLCIKGGTSLAQATSAARNAGSTSGRALMLTCQSAGQP